MIFDIFATLADFERDQIRERHWWGERAAREGSVSALRGGLGIERVTRSRYHGAKGTQELWKARSGVSEGFRLLPQTGPFSVC